MVCLNFRKLSTYIFFTECIDIEKKMVNLCLVWNLNLHISRLEAWNSSSSQMWLCWAVKEPSIPLWYSDSGVGHCILRSVSYWQTLGTCRFMRFSLTLYECAIYDFVIILRTTKFKNFTQISSSGLYESCILFCGWISKIGDSW